MWKANSDPWSTTEYDEWKNLSDIESMMIEDAFETKQDVAFLDDYHTVLSTNVQISNYDVSKQRPVKRATMGELKNRPLRQTRSMSNPIALNASFKKEHVLSENSMFIREVVM